MSSRLQALFTPAEFAGLPARNLENTTCVVFDIFRATSTIVTALAHGAASVIPVSEISEALQIREKHPDYLLAGEREGRRITANLSGGTDFDLGNSPSEFSPEKVGGRSIVITTTNGSRALRACAGASYIFAGSFLNLQATADAVKKTFPRNVLLVCSGTGEEAAYEDVLAAGALAELISSQFSPETTGDSVNIARSIFRQHSANLLLSVQESKNGKRLLSIPELRNDVSYCLQQDLFTIVARMQDGRITSERSHS